MGLLVEGKWQDAWYDTDKTGGKFERTESQFRERISAGGKHPAEENRYHLYVSLACPWAHRALIMLSVKKLEKIISVDVVHPHMLEHGWEFKQDKIGKYVDSQFNCKHLYEVYLKAKDNYTGRVTVPVLWDKKQQTIVNNESAEIIRCLNSKFNKFTDVEHDFYPERLRQEIDSINKFVYENINNGVYRCGFATTQDAYEEAFHSLFAALDIIEEQLQGQDYLVANTLTEADIRLFTTLIRFDAVYYSHFKTNKKQLKDYPSLQQHLANMYANPAIKKTVNFVHIKQHYFYSHVQLNPTRIVPLGPDEIINQTEV